MEQGADSPAGTSENFETGQSNSLYSDSVDRGSNFSTGVINRDEFTGFPLSLNTNIAYDRLKQVIKNPPSHSTVINNYVPIHSTVVNSSDPSQGGTADTMSNHSSESDNSRPQPTHHMQTRSKGPVGGELPNVQTGILERLHRKST